MGSEEKRGTALSSVKPQSIISSSFNLSRLPNFCFVRASHPAFVIVGLYERFSFSIDTGKDSNNGIGLLSFSSQRATFNSFNPSRLFTRSANNTHPSVPTGALYERSRCSRERGSDPKNRSAFSSFKQQCIRVKNFKRRRVRRRTPKTPHPPGDSLTFKWTFRLSSKEGRAGKRTSALSSSRLQLYKSKSLSLSRTGRRNARAFQSGSAIPAL
mmetsp:Transcript_18912/g.38198  ORF Transcript_18912/g.38198 Transcript_18912/m.38198 type:complete len:213 (-) Transcript_18912:125-763(-)